ncbi:histone-lysine N-methyltransferase, H3 lysine-79 specific-like [Leptopilina heterotoma]|uniref:histone-lysine N-methyltransferase, H3 lysine-79 specific-like n=1 Tax=Leptopilina heterotoma TaxID=63436 RepID=UPI001CAA0ADC|nr:histone-lysine N-methyltransferase, H3 lysine-79 specific-like [Leptopilina heterotoma]
MDLINEAELNVETLQPLFDKNEENTNERRLPMRNSILNIQYWVNTGKPPCLSILNENYKSPEEISLSEKEISAVEPAAISPFKKNSSQSAIIPSEPINLFFPVISNHSDNKHDCILSPNHTKKNSPLIFAENENESPKIRNQNIKYEMSIDSLSTFIYDCNKNVSYDSEASTLLRVDTKNSKIKDFIPLKKISELSPEKSTSEEMKDLFTLKTNDKGSIKKNHRRKLFTNSESPKEWPQYSSPKKIFKKSHSLTNNSFSHPALDYSPSEKKMQTWRKRSFYKKKIATSIKKNKAVPDENLIFIHDEPKEFKKSRMSENSQKNLRNHEKENSLIQKCFSKKGKITARDKKLEISNKFPIGEKEEKRELEIRKFTTNESSVLTSKRNLLTDVKFSKNKENVKSTELEAEIDFEKLEKTTTNSSEQEILSESTSSLIFSKRKTIFEPSDSSEESEKGKISTNHVKIVKKNFTSIFAFDSDEEFDMTTIFRTTRQTEINNEGKKFNFHSNLKEENSKNFPSNSKEENSRQKFISNSEESEFENIFETDNKIKETNNEESKFNFRSNSKQKFISSSEDSEFEDIFETHDKIEEKMNNEGQKFRFNSKEKFISSSEESELEDIFETNNKESKYNFRSNSKQKFISDSEESENIIRCKFRKNNRNLSKILHSLSSDDEDEAKDFRFSRNNRSLIKNGKNNKSDENKNLVKRKINNLNNQHNSNRFETDFNETSSNSDIFNLRPKKNCSMNKEKILLNSNETKIEDNKNNSNFSVNTKKVKEKKILNSKQENSSETKIIKKKHSWKFFSDSDDDSDIFHLDLKKNRITSEKNNDNEKKILSNLTGGSSVKTKIKEDFNNSTFITFSDSSDDIFILKSRKKGH